MKQRLERGGIKDTFPPNLAFDFLYASRHQDTKLPHRTNWHQLVSQPSITTGSLKLLLFMSIPNVKFYYDCFRLTLLSSNLNLNYT
jgi:hypothetical protein